MNTLTKLALGLLGQVRPRPPQRKGAPMRPLPPPSPGGGMPFLDALWQRQSQREFSTRPLAAQLLSDLLWSAAGVNREALGGRTAPSAMNAQEVDVYVALPSGLYLFEPEVHRMRMVLAQDVRAITGYQDFTDEAALDLVYVADHGRMKLVPAERREAYAYAAAGAMAQNVYLYCASVGLATVIRAWLDRAALGDTIGLEPDQQVLLAQTVGWPSEA